MASIRSDFCMHLCDRDCCQVLGTLSEVLVDPCCSGCLKRFVLRLLCLSTCLYLFISFQDLLPGTRSSLPESILWDPLGGGIDSTFCLLLYLAFIWKVADVICFLAVPFRFQLLVPSRSVWFDGARSRLHGMCCEVAVVELILNLFSVSGGQAKLSSSMGPISGL